MDSARPIRAPSSSSRFATNIGAVFLTTPGRRCGRRLPEAVSNSDAAGANRTGLSITDGEVRLTVSRVYFSTWPQHRCCPV